jgi:hypothetical protein
MQEPRLEAPSPTNARPSGPTKKERALEAIKLARQHPGEWVRVPGTARHGSGWQDVSRALAAGELVDDPPTAWDTTTRTIEVDDNEVRHIALYVKYIGSKA